MSTETSTESNTDRATAMAALRAEGLTCTRCDLYKSGTPVVWGEGDPNAGLVFIGQGPGEQETKRERPFIGPAGRLFDQALDEGGITRAKVWLTNGIKHWATSVNPRGILVNRAPKVGEVRACRVWLDGELAIVKPQVIVCLGASAVQALTGKAPKMGEIRGQWSAGPNGAALLATYHPSYLLRLQGADEAAAIAAWDTFTADLRTVRERAEELGVVV